MATGLSSGCTQVNDSTNKLPVVQRIPGFRLKKPESTAHPPPTRGKLNCTQSGEQAVALYSHSLECSSGALWNISSFSTETDHLPSPTWVLYRICISTCQNTVSFPFCHNVSSFCQGGTLAFWLEAAICLQLEWYFSPLQQSPHKTA